MSIKKSEMYQRIRAARKRAGLTQADVAAALETDRTAITKWESRDPQRRTRPYIDHLEEFAVLTRTPVWWLLSDAVDVLEPWPEVTNERADDLRAPRGAFVRAFWHRARLRACEIRPDLWPEEVWTPRAPEWMNPLLPEAHTHRCYLRWVEAQHVDMARIASLATSLLAFEMIQSPLAPARKALLVWAPQDQDLSQQEQTYRHDIARISAGAHLLCERLRVRYIEVANEDEAAHYLVQLL